ncbi:hypothetical protein NQZ68_008545 [Dissostichus eleginoides]|nr:hypothetical protein NQZ68_008545 [Dissostichus eleginoides]
MNNAYAIRYEPPNAPWTAAEKETHSEEVNCSSILTPHCEIFKSMTESLAPPSFSELIAAAGRPLMSQRGGGNHEAASFSPEKETASPADSRRGVWVIAVHVV